MANFTVADRIGGIGGYIGGIATLLGGLPMAGNAINAGATSYEKSAACMHDIDTSRDIAQKDATIARLESEKYTDAAKQEIKEYTTKGILDLYKYIENEMKTMKESANNKWTEQAVFNSTVNSGLTLVGNQIAGLQATVAGITRTAVPSSAICNFGCNCNCNNGNI